MRRIPDVLTAEEQKALINAANKRYYTGQRNRAILALMLASGLRVGEVTRLKWNDMSLNTGKLHIKQGKRNKDRILWVGEEIVDQLRAWADRQEADTDAWTGFMFTTRPGGQVSPRYIQAMVARLRQRCGLRKHITPHTLRHTFATDLLRQTNNLRLVQKALGHSSIKTTEIYTHIADEELEAALKGFRR